MRELPMYGYQGYGYRRWRYGRFSWAGLFLVLLGLWWLLGETGRVAFDWRYVGPIAIMVLGLGLLWRRWACSWCCDWSESGDDNAKQPSPPGPG